MRTLLISMLGGSAPGTDRPGHPLATYRLPGGERNVQTRHLGVDLAQALGVQTLCLVGTPTAYFEKLVELLPEDEALAPVPEPEPRRTQPEPPPRETPAESSAEDSAGSESETAASESGKEEASASADTATEELPEPVTEEVPIENVVSGEGPAAPSGGDAPPSAEAPAAPEEAAAAEETPAEAPSEAAATTTSAETSSDAPEATGDSSPTIIPQVPLKAHEPDTRSLAERLQEQARTGRADKGALAALGERLARAIHIENVRCVLISAPTDDRSFQASLRGLVELAGEGDQVHLDVTYGERTVPLLGTLAMHYLRLFRPDVRCGRIFEGAPEHADSSGVAPVLTLEAPLDLLQWMHAFLDLQRGMAPASIHAILNGDRRLQGLAGPYVRYRRGVAFGAVSEVIQGSQLIEERRKRISRLPYAHRFRIFDQVLRRTIQPFLGEAPTSHRQLELARNALALGHPPLAALHLREAALDYVLERFGQNPTRVWTEVPQSGGTQEVRTRDVASYVLSTPEARERFKDLELAWPLLQEARRHFSNIPGSTIPAGMLKQADHEITRIHDIVRNLILKDALRGIEEGRTFEDVTKESIDRQAVRPREARKRRRRGTRAEGSRPSSEGRRRSRPAGEGEGGRQARGRGPRGERPPRRDPADTTPRVERARGGMGNLGLALAGAGLVPEPSPPRKKAPEREKPAETEAPEKAAAEQAQEESPPPSRPASESPEPLQESAAESTGDSPPETAENVPEPTTEKKEVEERSFDVAGPGEPPEAV